MTSNFLNDSQVDWLKTVNDFMDKEVTVEYVRKCDTERQYPYEAYKKIAAQGWLGIMIPDEEGGSGGDIFDYSLMAEGLGKFGFDFACSVLVPTFTAMNIIKFGSAEQKAKYVRPFIDGEIRFSVSISEPDAGSDASNTKTHARRDENGDWIVNGSKLWCSGAAADDTVIAMLVRTDNEDKHGGLSVLLIPNDTPGLDIRKLPTLSRHATGTTEIFLDDVRVPAENLLGEVGQGWKIITDHLELERCAVAAAYTGNAQEAVNAANRYAQQRIQFGKPIYEFQVLKHMLAENQTRVDAARLLCYRAAQMKAQGLPAARETSMAKLYGSETLKQCALDGMQILGGYANLPEADMERYLRESVQSTIGGGTSQIQRTIIARSMRLPAGA
ncbi:acyl-CoA dehydrogenase family protein [Streptomyces cinereoruber]|uniref:Acyl-CoA dehydrogenase n=1 Tax=Streptomyces cinereoruber TaxID=67260 RepID=A0ABX6BL54_9ACTN|nr:acyl-CoA dehydrogenase family protein [Streptomyces cinereoruber]MBB4158236.1 alkylation response protein AidB-like acyl-CoA dehydrogenase [Streptomyces cinereoruber]MBY8819230.1 acyl-CoA dehydrogenase family protein [Streptomyces cinereoruber]NIH63369.1 alkylation response protein AidB-like acyl-CoA dehydrogenase [Streptomyces cinereoruber]QEV36026.1 acyl-CoA dehydrogenase [Streptomyces cinereoruber]